MLTVGSVCFFLLYWLPWLAIPIVSYKCWSNAEDENKKAASAVGFVAALAIVSLISTAQLLIHNDWSPYPSKAVVRQEVGRITYEVWLEEWKAEPWHSVKLEKRYKDTFRYFWDCKNAQDYADALNLGGPYRIVDCAQEGDR